MRGNLTGIDLPDRSLIGTGSRKNIIGDDLHRGLRVEVRDRIVIARMCAGARPKA